MNGSQEEQLHRELLAAQEGLEQARFREHVAWKRRNEAVREAYAGGLRAETVMKVTGIRAEHFQLNEASQVDED